MAKQKNSSLRRRSVLKTLLVFILFATLVITGLWAYDKIKTSREQSAVAPFYNTNGLAAEGTPGELIRSEPLNAAVEGGAGYRILYRTQRADNSYTFSSGMVFVPNQAADSPRPVVAWAHGTLGMGDACAPSRSKTSTNVPGLSEMMSRGWVVAATDYAGLGTEGTEGYLVGGDEARDVLNSVRAAQQLDHSQAGNSIVVWGHSQGGHSALFTSHLAGSYAPEFNIKGTVASAPAAELEALLNEQNGTALDWVIGPEVMVSWPMAYPGLSPDQVLSSAGKKNYQRIAQKCIEQASEEGLLRHALKQQFFAANPMDNPDWQKAASQQAAPILSPSQPLLVVESLSDQVILPNTTALYIQRACQGGSNVSSLWLADVGHIKLAPVSAPQVVAWLSDRLDGRPANNTCYQTPPIAPAPNT